MNTSITGAILAGGKSSRMGTDKGLLLINEKNMVERIAELLKPFVSELIIISNGHNYDYLGYKIYHDLIKDCGPMGGMYTALAKSKTEKNFIISCDMPFVSPEIIESIIKNSDNCQVAIPLHAEGVEPLCGVYDKSCISKFEELLENKKWKLKDALKHFALKQIPMKETIFVSHCFTNINTPAEYEKVKSGTHEYSN